MKCPRCHVELRHAEYDGDIVYQCNRCAGYLAERNGLMLVNLASTPVMDTDDGKSGEPFKPAEILRAAGVLADDKHKEVRCPRCHSQMNVRQIAIIDPSTPRVDLDECKLCHAVWFDPSELLRLQKNVPSSKQAISDLRTALILADSTDYEPVLTKSEEEDPELKNAREFGDISLLICIVATALLTLSFKIFEFDFLAGMSFMMVTSLIVVMAWRFTGSTLLQTIYAVMAGVFGTLLSLVIWLWR